MDASEYKHVVLGLIFLKYLSDVFEEQHEVLKEQGIGVDNEQDYQAEGLIWLPEQSRWSYLQSQSEQPNIATIIDRAMTAIEKKNKLLKDLLPKSYARS